MKYARHYRNHPQYYRGFSPPYLMLITFYSKKNSMYQQKTLSLSSETGVGT